jgi:hypothetical protein
MTMHPFENRNGVATSPSPFGWGLVGNEDVAAPLYAEKRALDTKPDSHFVLQDALAVSMQLDDGE